MLHLWLNLLVFNRKNDQTQLAFVTFKQPYAFQTALLLNVSHKNYQRLSDILGVLMQ